MKVCTNQEIFDKIDQIIGEAESGKTNSSTAAMRLQVVQIHLLLELRNKLYPQSILDASPSKSYLEG
jgi:hypothetical protein